MKSGRNPGFSMALASFDAVPVVLFSISMLLIADSFGSMLFIAGSVLCTASGVLKVMWKTIAAASGRDIRVLSIQMRFLMPSGFILIIAGLISGMSMDLLGSILDSVSSFPACLFFIMTAICMLMMAVFSVKLDQSSERSNWIEELTNAAAQLSFLIGVVLCRG